MAYFLLLKAPVTLNEGNADMGDSEIFGKTIDILKSSMDMRAARHLAISSNIANYETPNYKAKDLKFDKVLADEIRSNDAIKLNVTNPKHFILSGTPSSSTGVTVEENDTANMDRNNGNTVNIDQEMVKLAENGIMYDALSQIIARQFNSLKDVIKGY
ncbi:MAG: flagellar basal body rod protein FlgB [Candidatus Schekmanbacteria bacterium]|nr:flagellar basal body rod protein FlgB [Candidatus Schekmanbacteria bacterium]